jgi:hypothetical protein
VTTKTVPDLVTIHEPQLPGDNKTRIVPDETNVYRVQARLAKWKHESDGHAPIEISWRHNLTVKP